MTRRADVPHESSAAERSGVRAPVLRENRHGKRDQNDCGPGHHEMILHRIEFLFFVPSLI
jgi:hypothetical protein